MGCCGTRDESKKEISQRDSQVDLTPRHSLLKYSDEVNQSTEAEILNIKPLSYQRDHYAEKLLAYCERIKN